MDGVEKAGNIKVYMQTYTEESGGGISSEYFSRS